MSDILYVNHPLGEGSLEALGTPLPIDLANLELVPLPKARIHNGLFEVPYRAVMELLLPSLHPATPAYGSLMFVDAPDSRIGPFTYAIFGVACRSGIRPRMLTLSAFASSDDAAKLLKSFGIPAKKASIDTRYGYDATVSTLRDDHGRVLVEMSTLMSDVLLGSIRAIRYPQPLAPASIDGETGLIQFDMAFEYDEAWRGPMSLRTFDAAAMSGGHIVPTDLIGGSFVKGNVTIQRPRLLLDSTEVGLAQKLPNSEKIAA